MKKDKKEIYKKAFDKKFIDYQWNNVSKQIEELEAKFRKLTYEKLIGK